MTKTTKAMLRISPLGIVASAILFAGCVAPAGAIQNNNLSDRARDPNVTTHSSFSGVARNNMSDAARQANVAAAQTFQGVAKSNMSDAARKAVYGPRLRRHH
jgi:uncharacterized lipoprotein YajG